tara:strand:+ start:4147 stop:5112 length:966 start_codon:yes stop_codon:yes gene_type:complete
MAAKKFNEIKKELPLEEGKLVSDFSSVLDKIMSDLKSKLGREYQKNSEKGIAMINTIGAMVGAKVTDKKQSKNRLFLKFGDEPIQEDAAVDAANLKAKQAEELERLQAKHELELENLQDRHEREMERINQQKEKEAINKQIEAERESARKANESVELEEKAPDTEDAMKRHKAGKAGFGDITHLKAKGLIPRADGTKKKSPKYEDKEEQDRDVGKNKGTQPKKYYKGLDKETKQKRDAHFKQGKTGPAPGDKDDEGNPIKTKKSTHTKKFAKMYGEKLTAKSDAGDYIDDFRKSDAPQFKGKSDKKIRKMAIAAYLSKKEK